jgi:hypothetical protein
MVDYFNDYNKSKARKTNTDYRNRRAHRNYGAKATSKVGYSYFITKITAG